jgi:hypothetical protein
MVEKCWTRLLLIDGGIRVVGNGVAGAVWWQEVGVSSWLGLKCRSDVNRTVGVTSRAQ